VFGCVAWAHISNDFRKKLDAKSHACIMMGYYEEFKANQQFDHVKEQIIIIQNLLFDEKSYSIKLLNAFSRLLQDDRFDVISDYGSPILFLSSLTRQSNYVHVSTRPSTSESINLSISVSTGLSSSSTKIVLTSDQPSRVNISSPLYFLPIWDSKTIEVVGSDVGDISPGRESYSQKKHANFALMTHVLETSNHVTYSYAQGQPKWE
jgi:hypothetical protein